MLVLRTPIRTIFIGENTKLDTRILTFSGNAGMEALDQFRSELLDKETDKELLASKYVMDRRRMYVLNHLSLKLIVIYKLCSKPLLKLNKKFFQKFLFQIKFCGLVVKLNCVALKGSIVSARIRHK